MKSPHFCKIKIQISGRKRCLIFVDALYLIRFILMTSWFTNANHQKYWEADGLGSWPNLINFTWRIIWKCITLMYFILMYSILTVVTEPSTFICGPYMFTLCYIAYVCYIQYVDPYIFTKKMNGFWSLLEVGDNELPLYNCYRPMGKTMPFCLD